MKYKLPTDFETGHKLTEDWKFTLTFSNTEKSLVAELNKFLKKKIEVDYYGRNYGIILFKKGSIFRVDRVDSDCGKLERVGLRFEKNSELIIDETEIKISKEVLFKVSIPSFEKAEFEFIKKELAPRITLHTYPIRDGKIGYTFEKNINAFICSDKKCKNYLCHNGTDKFCSKCGSEIIPGTLIDSFYGTVYLASKVKMITIKNKGDYEGLVSKDCFRYVTSMSNGQYAIYTSFSIGEPKKFEIQKEYGRGTFNRNGYELNNLKFPVYYSNKKIDDKENIEKLKHIGTATSITGAAKLAKEHWEKLYE